MVRKKVVLFVLLLLTKIVFAAAPVIESILPVSGYNDEFTNITIHGQNYDSACKVFISSNGPYTKGTVDTYGKALGVYTNGNYLYIADHTFGLRIIDISNPASPAVKGIFDTPGYAYGVYVNGNYAYVADYDYGLQIIDISDPVTPILKGTYDTPGWAYAVYVNGNYAYVADYDCGLQIIDISDPETPILKGIYNTPGFSYAVHVIGNYAYLADESYGLQIIDISDPASPTLKGAYNTPGYAFGINVNGNYAYVGDYDYGLQVIDISDPASPILKGTYNTPGYAYGVHVNGNYAYVADETNGLQIIDVSDRENPILKENIDTPGYAREVYVYGNNAYIADDSYGVQIIDIGNPSTPGLKGTYNTSGDAEGVYIKGHYAYKAYGYSGLKIIDISDPASPILIGTYNTPGYAYGIYVNGNYAYVADDSYGLQIIDVSDPASPILKGTYDTPGYAYRVFVKGNYAYVADGGSGLQIIDVSDPANPILKGAYNTPGYAYGICVNGSYAYLADNQYGLQIIGISDPASPVLKGTYNTPGYAVGVYVNGKNAYVADGGSGLQIIDVIDPAKPVLKGTYNTPGYANEVYVNGNYVYVADDTTGLKIIDISDPALPRLRGINNKPEDAEGIYVNGNYVYIADGLYGLQIIQKISAVSECINISHIDSTSLTADILTRLSPGKYNLTITKPNGEQGFLSYCFEVLQGITADSAPIIDPIGDKIINEYETLSFAITGSDPDSDKIFYDILSLPNGANFNTNTGEFTWSPNYLQIGMHEVIFGIFDGELDGYETISITVNDVPLTATLIASETTGITPLIVNFTANSSYSNAGIEKYEWDLDGNGSYETATTGDTSSYIYNSAGIYNAQVRLTAYANEKVISTKTIIAINVLPAVKLIASETTGITPSFTVNYTAEAYDSNGTIINYEWDLDGNGSYETATMEKTRSYIYYTAGVYNAKVRVTDNENSKTTDTATIVVINIPPAVKLTASETTGVTPSFTVNYTAEAYDSNGIIVKYEWDLDGNGNYETATSGRNKMSYIYNTPGIYNAKVRVTDNENSKTTDIETIVIINILPAVTLKASETTGVNPLTVNFTANAHDPNGTIIRYEWDFDGNGSYETTNGNIFSCRYITAGTYNAKVKVTDNDGGAAESVVIITIKINNLLTAGNIDTKSPGSENRIDGSDLFELSRVFGAYPKDANWDSYADLNNDGIVDGKDLVILAVNFGKIN